MVSPTRLNDVRILHFEPVTLGGQRRACSFGVRYRAIIWPHPCMAINNNYAAHKTESIRTWLLTHPRFPVPLHTDILVADVSSREMVLGLYRRVPTAQRTDQCDRTRQRDYQVGQGLERETQALHLDQERRRSLRFYAKISGPLVSQHTSD